MGNLDRFLKAQEWDYGTALSEIRSGRKRSHWIWYIFPQIKGLGFSEMSWEYGLDGLREAREYMAHPLLRERIIEISNALLCLGEDGSGTGHPSALQIMGSPDDMKLKSSMTIFAEAAPDEPVFQAVLDKYYGGERDVRTLKRIAVSVEEMRKSDAYTIAHGTSGRELMRRAAEGVYRAYEAWSARNGVKGGVDRTGELRHEASFVQNGRDGWAGRNIAIMAGGGNNGGDGYALAGILKENGINPVVYRVSDKMSADGEYYAGVAKDLGVRIEAYSDSVDLDRYDIIVDCILGTGFSGELRGMAAEAIRAINASGALVISVDINSGMNGDTGEAALAVKSDLTVSIGYYKKGMFSGEASRLIGSLVNVDIGIILPDN